MSTRIDLTGQEFFGIKILERKGFNNKTVYRCLCRCGVEFWRRSEYVKKSSGCKVCRYKFCKPTKPIKDIVNNEYNNIKVLSFSQMKGSRSYWNCLCKCGNQFEVEKTNLIKGHTKSCGCIRKEKSKIKKIPNVNSSFTETYRSYKQGAIKRNLSFELSKEEALDFFNGLCYYCKAEPTNIGRNRHNEFRYNGIDRLDNNIGYIKENCVSCCKICNRMKSNHTMESFKNHIKTLYRKFYES